MAPYHHGNLRDALLAEARVVIETEGLSGLTLRHLARRLGVSHAAPGHHFADRRALITALAAEGHRRLADGLEACPPSAGAVDLGAVYVSVATGHPADFAVMFRPDLLDGDDPEYREQSARARGILRSRFGAGRDPSYELAAWAIAHGLSELILAGAIPREVSGGDAAIRAVLGHLAADDSRAGPV